MARMIAGWKAQCFILILSVITTLSSSLSTPKITASTAGPRSLPGPNEMGPDRPIILSQEKVSRAIEDACSREQSTTIDHLRDYHNLTVERVVDWGPIVAKAGAAEGTHDVYLQKRTPWHFGIAIRDAHQKDNVIGFVTFFVAYSSWSGRILYLDQMQLDSRMNDDVEKVLLQLLAEIALELDCVRLTWRHHSTPDWHSIGTNQPEMHAEVLTLSMDEDAMMAFVGSDPSTVTSDWDVASPSKTALDDISTCLDGINQSSVSGFRLRLAKGQDLQTIEDLVHGLADYVNEADAVELTAQDYLNDGFAVDDPLWLCVLIDKIRDDGDSHTCGYAFVYFGYELGHGRFIYLEDLYVQSEYRGGGGGKMTMKALASIGLSRKCHRIYWQALDWNTASLNFYDSIGAKIHTGERTSRYAGDTLKKFAKNGVLIE